MGTAFLEGEKLLGAESLVVSLAGGFDKILKVSAQQEVAQVHKLAVVLVLNIDDAPAVLAATDLLAIDDDGFFGTDDGEGHKGLDVVAQGTLLIVELFVVVGEHLEVVESELLLDALLELLALLHGQSIGLGNYRDDVDDVG